MWGHVSAQTCPNPKQLPSLLKPQVSTESRDAQGLGETFLFNLSDWLELYEVV